jgi:Flp pilus assembly protein TadD
MQETSYLEPLTPGRPQRRNPSIRPASLSFALATALFIPSISSQVPEPKQPRDLAAVKHLIEEGQFPAAESSLRSSLLGEPSLAEARYLLAYVLFRERKPVDSLAEYTAAARLRQPTSGDLIVIASDYILLKDFADAEHWLLLATANSPDDPTGWYLLGRTQYNEDHAAEAITSFQRCLHLRPHDSRAEYNLGLAYEKLQRPADAIAAYNTAIDWQRQQGIQDPQPFLDLGMLLLTQRHAPEALEPLRQAVQAGPSNALAQQELGLALEALGRYTEAIAPLRRAAELAPAAEQPHFMLGRIYRRLGRTSEAAAEFATVAHLAGSHSNTETPNVDTRP